MEPGVKIFLGIFGFCWLVIATVSESSYFSNNSIYILNVIAGFALLAASFLPRSFLHRSLIAWSFVVAIVIVEFGLALGVYNNLRTLYGTYQSVQAGTEVFPESAPTGMRGFAGMATFWALLSAALVFSALRLLRRN